MKQAEWFGFVLKREGVFWGFLLCVLRVRGPKKRGWGSRWDT